MQLLEKFLRRIDEPRVCGPRRCKIADLLADRRQIVMSRQRLGILFYDLFEESDCIGRLTAFGKQICQGDRRFHQFMRGGNGAEAVPGRGRVGGADGPTYRRSRP